VLLKIKNMNGKLSFTTVTGSKVTAVNNHLKIMLLLCTALICSCSNNSKQSGTVNREGQKLYTMQAMPYKTFDMDENTSQIAEYFQLFTIDDTLRFTMYSNTKVRKNILIFDISTGRVVDSVRLYQEGPHAIHNNIKAYYIQNMDSIYLYDYWQHTFILVNRKGEIVNRINLSEKFLPENNSETVSSSPFPNTSMPIHRINNIFILQGMTQEVNSTKKIQQLRLCVIYRIPQSSLSTRIRTYMETQRICLNTGEFFHISWFHTI
jgi:hypothetical protein